MQAGLGMPRGHAKDFRKTSASRYSRPKPISLKSRGKGTYGGSYILPVAERSALERAAQLLATEWEVARTGEQTLSIEQIAPASAAMVAWKLTRQQDKALTIARQLVDAKVSDPQALLNAAQIINDAGDRDYVEKALALAPNAPELKFLKAVRLVDEGDWDGAATILKELDVPNDEREIVQAMVTLAPYRDAARVVTETELRGVMPKAEADPRALIAFARVVRHRGFFDLAAEAYANARKGITPESNMAPRLMVASYAADSNDATALIELLQGYIPIDEPSNELLWLATAHAIQRPKRPANEEFFKSLPASIRDLPAYAKSHATVLLQLGSIAEAVLILKSLRETTPEDAYVILRLVEAYARLDQAAELKKLAEEIDPANLEGRPEHLMAVAQFLSQHDRTQEALPLGYEILQANQDNPRVALGYTGLFLLDPQKKVVDTPETVQTGTAVVLKDESGSRSSLLIDSGSGLWGIEARPASAEDVKGLIGQKKGFKQLLPRRFQTNEFQEIVEVKSKYLHVFHILMDQFEARFPGHGGLWKIKAQGDDIKPFLEAVRDMEEADRQTARRYTDDKWPLAFVARMLGRDALSFAAYLRHLGKEVFTCEGKLDERNAAVALAVQHQGRGATLDFYTAAVAAQIGALPILKEWFGKLYVPSSAIALLDSLIAREQEKSGQESMSITWTDAGYVRHIPTEEEIRARIAALERSKEQITTHATVEKELLPNDVPELVANIAEKLGDTAFEGIYLARRKGTIFVCDDMPLHVLAKQFAKVQGLWLQPILIAARDAEQLDAGQHSKLLAGLATNGHYTSIGSDDLENAFQGVEGATFYDYAALARCLGGKTAEMRSHVGVAVRFLFSLWGADARGHPQREKATSLLLESLVRDRQTDWAEAIGYTAAALHRHPPAIGYIASWLKGHFLPLAPVNAAYNRYRKTFERQVALSMLKESSSPMALSTMRRES